MPTLPHNAALIGFVKGMSPGLIWVTSLMACLQVSLIHPREHSYLSEPSDPFFGTRLRHLVHLSTSFAKCHPFVQASKSWFSHRHDQVHVPVPGPYALIRGEGFRVNEVSIIQFFFKFIYLFILTQRQREGDGQRGRERESQVSSSLISWISQTVRSCMT